MEFALPTKTHIHRNIPKVAFYRKTTISTRIKDQFVHIIDKITFAYKLAPETIQIPRTPDVAEIHIFEITLKQKEIPKQALQTIDRSIPYPILFVLQYQEEQSFAMISTHIPEKPLYISDWGANPHFEFSGATLEILYQNLVRSFLPTYQTSQPIEQQLTQDIQRQKLEREISSLKSKIRKTSQFKEQVELNRRVRELEELIK